MTDAVRASEPIVRRVPVYSFDSIARTFPDHIPLYTCAVLFDAVLFGIMGHYGIVPDLRMGWLVVAGFFQFAIIAAGLIALWELARIWRDGTAQSPFNALKDRLFEKLMAGDRPGNILHSLAALTPLMLGFTAFKNAIPAMHPFSWDRVLAAFDQNLGFGHAPWIWLQPLLGHPPITAAINIVYDGWFVVVMLCMVWQGFAARRSSRRLQFLLAYAMAWFFAGSLLALIFSSAGPCYYGHIFPGSDLYAAQMQYLRQIGPDWIWSLGVQDSLWDSYRHGGGVVSGISAMPSMHVMIAVLTALLGIRTNRRLGIALSLFAALIVLGSIHLAWHYAADGIAGIVLAVLVWWLSGLVARRWMEGIMPTDTP